ncbi:RNA polymerase sigma factor [Halomonas korlensis]|uniref:RNA polymerase sigma-70 factor, ECF subfamily n=1 Tax=Halomonas korlensis TaxID=463301 RepID=A0A1I7G8Z7_9GAMM|nr:RNA polymerase sigma factor [Halomonas korlensis]SFU44736.1 RNA polymerase sigma-70 factor, ECF subfamily [Halomonas korlensis]
MPLAHPDVQAPMPRPEMAYRGDSGVGMSDRDIETRQQWFEQRLAPLLDRLYGCALRLTRDPDDAEDIVAEAVGKAWTRLGELRDPQCFDGWLLHILNNVFISEWRRRQCRPQRPTSRDAPAPDELDTSTFTLFQQLHQPFLLWWGSLEEQFFNSLLQEDIQRAIDALPDPFRVTMVLVEVQGYSYAEAAHLLGIPLGTVRSRLSRARALLQKTLWEQAGDAGVRPDGDGTGRQRP